MNIRQAKEHIKNSVTLYLKKIHMENTAFRLCVKDLYFCWVLQASERPLLWSR